MNKISAVMIVKNEEKCLERCLKSIKDIDEIIILDTGSSDNTIEIAKKYTNKVFANEYKWKDNFADARNYALTKATGDWVLSIDADEWLESNGINKIRKGVEFAEAHKQITINCIMQANGVLDEFYFPRLFKKCKEIYWKGAAHNYLNHTDDNKSDIKITYSYSAAHELDKDRTLRILSAEVKNNPNCLREAFYLAREYWYRKNYNEAIKWYKDYLSRANWAPEMAEANLMIAKSYKALNEIDQAKNYCLQAIKINADFKEAFNLMVELSGIKNREKWLLFAELANDNDVLFTRKNKIEQNENYYNRLFASSSDMSRYYHIYNKIGQMVSENEKVLDIGCGVAVLQKFIKNYNGFDFSDKAVKTANHPNVFIENAYNKYNYKEEYDTYIITETLEHLDDLKILDNIPKGKRVIFSVPSFNDPSHLRRYNEEIIKYRYNGILDIKSIVRFNWKNEWKQDGELTREYILLVDSIKR